MSVLSDYISHIEGLQDALTKRNARIAELEKLLDVYIEIGERKAEQRIIELLEHMPRTDNDRTIDAPLAIELIKGKTK